MLSSKNSLKQSVRLRHMISLRHQCFIEILGLCRLKQHLDVDDYICLETNHILIDEFVIIFLEILDFIDPQSTWGGGN